MLPQMQLARVTFGVSLASLVVSRPRVFGDSGAPSLLPRDFEGGKPLHLVGLATATRPRVLPNSDVEADETLGRGAPSGLRSLMPVVMPTQSCARKWSISTLMSRAIFRTSVGAMSRPW